MSESRKKRPPKLRAMIFISIVLIAMVPAVSVSWVLIDSVFEREIEYSKSELQGQVLILSNQLSGDDYFSHYTDSGKNSDIEQIADIWGGRIQVMNSGCKILVDTYRLDVARYNVSEYVLAAMDRQSVSYLDDKTMTLIIAQPIYSATQTEAVVPPEDLAEGEEVEYQPRIDGVIMVCVDMSRRTSALSGIRNQMYLLWIAAASLTILAALLVLIRFFRPFGKLNSEIDAALEGTAKKVSVRDYSEFSKLSDSANRLLDRINSLDDSRQEFVSNVSHELKTPITSMRVLADTLNGMDEVPNEMYRDFMRDISSELEREGNIIDDLLSMSRLEGGRAELHLSEVNLNEWIESTLRRISPIAKVAGVEVTFESFRPVTAQVDEIKLTLALTNIVENAVKYNEEGGWVKVSLNADHHYFFIKVEDSGSGIPKEAMPHLFERFYRVDRDRSRESGGTGLGLSIAKQIINLHHGAIRAYSELGDGTTFVIRIPLEYRDSEYDEYREVSDEKEA